MLPKTSATRVANQGVAKTAERLAFWLFIFVLATPFLMSDPSLVVLAARLLLGLGFVAWLVSGSLRNKKLRLTLPFYVLAFYLCISFISALSSVNRYESLQTAFTLAAYTQGFVLAHVLVSTPSRRRIFIGSVLTVASIMMLYGFLQVGGVNLTPRLGSERYAIASFFYHYSHYAGYLALITPLTLSVALFRGGLLPWLFFSSAFLSLLLTLSWDTLAFISLVCFALVFTWLLRKKGRAGLRTGIFMLMGGTLVLGGSVMWGAKATHLPYLSSPARFQRMIVTRLENRYAIYEGVFSVVAEAPLLGVGPGNFIYSYPKYKEVTPRFPFLRREVNHAHSDFLQVASETGLLGLASYLVFWLSILFSSSSGWSPGLTWGLKAGLVALFSCGLLDVNLTVIPANALLAWLMAGALCTPWQKHPVSALTLEASK